MNWYKQKKSLPSFKYGSLVYGKNSKFLWCPVQKAASSSWFLNLHILGGGSLSEAAESVLTA